MRKHVTLLFLLALTCLKGWTQTTTITTPGTSTYTVPAGVTSITVEVWGGGGAGGGYSNLATTFAGGGSGGGYVRTVRTVTPGQQFTVTVGAGGVGNTGTGGDGGSSWFGSATTLLAVGGKGAVGITAENTGGPGAAAVNTGNIGGTLASFYGGAGGNGSTTTQLSGGGGSSAGTSSDGNAANGATGGVAVAGGGAGAAGVANTDGLPGTAPGGGGSGGGNRSGKDKKTGGAGGAGKVVITACPTTFSFSSASAAAAICNGASATINLNSTALAANNNYSVTYNITGANPATGLTGTFSVTTAGTGSFTTGALANTGTTAVTSTITITGITNNTTGCVNTISAPNNTANVTINPTTAIGTNPVGTTYCQNATATALTVAATGANLSYQWFSNTTNSTTGGTPVGTNSSSFTPPTTTAGTLFYYVTVTGTCGTATSTTATVVVNPATAIGTNPVGTTYCQNATATALTVGASGTGTLSYQWFSNTTNSTTGGTPVGTNSSSFTPPTTTVGTTFYYVTVTGGCGTATSTPVSVVVNANTTITGQPLTTQTVCQGATTTASVTATGTNLTYQWFSNTTNSNTGGTIVTGATSATLTPSTTVSGTTYYYVVVTGSCGVATSNTSAVIVNQKSADPTSVTASATTICLGSSTVLTLNGGGGGTGETIKWYTGSCGGTVVGTGNNLTVSPTTTTTYFGRYEDGAPCNYTSACATLTITVNVLPTVAPITGPQYVGVGRDINLQDATTGGTWSVDNTAFATISSTTANPVTVHGVSVGNPIVTYTITDPTTLCQGSASITIHVFDATLAHYLTNQDGNFTNPVIWNINRNDGNGEVPSEDAPGNDDNITIRHNVLLNRNYSGNAAASLEITAGTLTIPPNLFIRTDGAIDFGGHPVVVQSDATGTGAIGPITNSGGIIANATNVTVERFIGSTENPAGKRAWQLLTAPVTGVTINNSWQEGQVSNTTTPVVGDPKYGTLITGRAQGTATNAFNHGYDFWPVIANRNASILHYHAAPVTGSWDTLPDPGLKNLSIESYPAYMLFVRGNRSVLDTGKSVTTLRATGTLKQGTQTITVPAGNTQAYTLIGNPYASPLDFNRVFNTTGTNGVLQQFTIWNSNLGDYGAYELVKWNGTNYTIVPFPFTGTPVDNDQARYIPSGAGFFIQPSSATADGQIKIIESSKAAGQTALVNPFRLSSTSDKKLYVNLNIKNGTTTATLADGVLARFGDDFSTDINADDARKLPNFYENLGISSNSSDLIVDARPGIVQTDTIQLKLWNVSKRSYQLQLKAESFDDTLNMHAWLEDSYLNTRQEVKLNGAITTVDFAVTSESGSYRNDRFRVVFTNTGVVLPVVLKEVKAIAKDGGVSVNWTVENEMNIRHYTVERSVDGGKTYTPIATTDAKNGASGVVTTYNSFDALPARGDNLYRIKIESKEGALSYSGVVLVTIGEGKKDLRITLYPNPVSEGRLNVQLSNLATGKYLVSLYGVSGQKVYEKNIIITQPNSQVSELLLLGNQLAQGSYQLRIANENGAVVKKAGVLIVR